MPVMQMSAYECIYRNRSSLLITVYPRPGLNAPPGLPTPFGIRDPDGLIISGGRAPLALLISGRADFTCLIDPALFSIVSDCLLSDPFLFCSFELALDSVFFTISVSFCRDPI